jgi:hypothetical protein
MFVEAFPNVTVHVVFLLIIFFDFLSLFVLLAFLFCLITFIFTSFSRSMVARAQLIRSTLII